MQLSEDAGNGREPVSAAVRTLLLLYYINGVWEGSQE